ncbi:hypothetical protein JCM10207_000214 [Rhodosporidiobolus poonsookiae]
MPPIETRRCCVCAIETENRCAACSAVGTDLFFCSKEHQKLVWKVHKRFCGKASFEQTLLEREEAEHAKRTAHTFTDSGNHTLASIFSRSYSEIDAATQGSGVMSSRTPFQLRGDALLIRSMLGRDASYQKPDPLLGPLSLLARFEAELQLVLKRDAEFQPVSELPWYSPLMHQLAVTFAIASSPHSAADAPVLPGLINPWFPVQPAIYIPAYLSALNVVKTRVAPLAGGDVAEKVRGAIDSSFRTNITSGMLKHHATKLEMLDCL